jgi:hypothetical protein
MLACFFILTATTPKSTKANNGRSKNAETLEHLEVDVGDAMFCVGEAVGLAVGFWVGDVIGIVGIVVGCALVGLLLGICVGVIDGVAVVGVGDAALLPVNCVGLYK